MASETALPTRIERLGELAHKKEQLQKHGDESGNTQIIERLRAEMALLAPAAKV